MMLRLTAGHGAAGLTCIRTKAAIADEEHSSRTQFFVRAFVMM
jgi:hypothetical protein